MYAMQIAVIPKGACLEMDKIIHNFVWGQSIEKSEIHLVKWGDVCRVTDCGGLGVRRMEFINDSSLLKVTF